MTMYAQLGDLAFQRREYFTGLEGTKTFGYAEQPHLEGKPGLQAVADGLDTYTLDMVFHHFWCDPAASIDKMAEVAARKVAQSLVFGTGEVLGQFVVTEMVKTWQHTGTDGLLLYAVLRVSLKEFVDVEPLETSRKRAVATAPAVKAPAKGTKPSAPKAGVKAKTGTPASHKPVSAWPGELSASEIARN